eukprot:g17947.t1
MDTVKTSIFDLAEQHVDVNELKEMWKVLFSVSGVDLTKKDAQTRTIELVKAYAESNQVLELFKNLYSMSGVNLMKSEAQAKSLELGKLGCDPVALLNSFKAAQGSTTQRLDQATDSAIRANLNGEARRYAKDGTIYNAKEFQDYYHADYKKEWANGVLEMKIAPDGKAYTASHFRIYFGRRSTAMTFPRAFYLASLLDGTCAEDTSWRRSVRLMATFLGLDFVEQRQSGKLEILGAGFSGSGAKSLQIALEKLGHKIYDIRSIIQWGHASAWIATAKELRDGNRSRLEQMLSMLEDLGYTATMDFPMNLPWNWLLDLKFNQQLLKVLWDFDWPFPSYPDHIWRPLPWFEIVTSLPAFAAEKREELSELEQNVSSKRFLVFEVQSGWQPLLEFLAVHDAVLAISSFPHANQIAGLRAARTMLDMIAVTLPLWLILAVDTVDGDHGDQGDDRQLAERFLEFIFDEVSGEKEDSQAQALDSLGGLGVIFVRRELPDVNL